MTIIEFRCPACDETIKAPEHFAGKHAKCPHCKGRVEVPDEGGEPEGEDGPDVEGQAVEHGASVDDDLPPVATPATATPLIVASGAALLGAGVWAAICALTYYEIGWIAWGIGGLIGLGAVATGGRGQTLAVACGGLALASIFVGKLLASQFILDNELQKGVAQNVTQEVYNERQVDARDFVALDPQPDPEKLKDYLVQHGFSEGLTVEDVSDQEVANFLAEIAPDLKDFAARQPSLEEWRDEFVAKFKEEISLVDVVVEDLGLFDLLFVFLGVSTAFGMVMRATQQDAAVVREGTRRRRRR